MKILFDNNVKNAVISEETNGFSYHKGSIADGRLTQSFAELQKLLLMAVIEKEAEEKYPTDKGFEREFNGVQKAKQKMHIDWWQSLIDRLPSEEEIEKEFQKTATDIVYAQTQESPPRTIPVYNDFEEFKFNAGANYIISKLLPSLPSTANCEVEITDGKIEVKKITI